MLVALRYTRTVMVSTGFFLPVFLK